MAWLAVNQDKTEVVLGGWEKPCKNFKDGKWWSPVEYNDVYWNQCVELPKGTIKKLIGRELTWKEEPVKLEEK